MDTQKITKQFRLTEWSEAVEERIASGQTIDAYCEAKSISKATYYYRQKKVREAACPELPAAQIGENVIVPAGWTQLAEAESVTASENSLTIEVNGCHIQANAQTDPKLLAKICRVLRSL